VAGFSIVGSCSNQGQKHGCWHHCHLTYSHKWLTFEWTEASSEVSFIPSVLGDLTRCLPHDRHCLSLEPCPQALFCSSSGVGSMFLPGMASSPSPPSYAPHIAGITSMYHHTWLAGLKWNLKVFFFAWAGLELYSNHDPSDIWLSSSWNYRCEPLCLDLLGLCLELFWLYTHVHTTYSPA
jgi:hypothetical protein